MFLKYLKREGYERGRRYNKRRQMPLSTSEEQCIDSDAAAKPFVSPTATVMKVPPLLAAPCSLFMQGFAARYRRAVSQ